MSKRQEQERPVTTPQAAEMLGAPGKPWSHTRIAALKSAAGLKSVRSFFLSVLLKFLAKNPNWQIRHVYPSPAPRDSRPGPRNGAAGKLGESQLTHDQCSA